MNVFTGVCVAMVTPFDKHGKVDTDALGRLVDFLLAQKADALCVLGTTGEPATMTDEEKREVAGFTIDRVAGRVPVIVGCGHNDTHETVRAAVEAENLGADALLVVTPYYNKCTQKGLVAHYSEVASRVETPIIAYNVPSRTGVNIKPETAAELAAIENVVGIKEASGDMRQVQEIARLTEGKLDLYMGEDALTFAGLTMGAKGVISVAANVVPKAMRKITESYFSGDLVAARRAQFKLLPLIDALFSEVNPIPVKKAVAAMGFGSPVPRLPLTEMEKTNAERLLARMRSLGVIG